VSRNSGQSSLHESNTGIKVTSLRLSSICVLLTVNDPFLETFQIQPKNRDGPHVPVVLPPLCERPPGRFAYQNHDRSAGRIGGQIPLECPRMLKQSRWLRRDRMSA